MKARKRPWWHRLLLYGGIALGLYAGLCIYLAGVYLSPRRTNPALPNGLVAVTIPTGNVRTPAWASPGLASRKPSKVVFVLAHGYGGDRAHWTQVAKDLSVRGYDSVIPAMPGQDQSPYPTVGFGTKEAEVLVDTYAWVRRNGARPKIVVVGVSMGGAAAWLSSELDPTISGVVSEGAYARFDRAMLHWLDSLPGGSVTLRPVVWLASARSGIKPESIVPEDAARTWRGKPALVMQGSKDVLIEKWHAERLAAAADCELMEVPGAVHACCQDVLREKYADRLVEFARAIGG